MAISDVNYHHPEYNKHKDDWLTVGHCVEGERAMRANRDRYLPDPADLPPDADTQAILAHQNRMTKYAKRAAFVNATGRTLQSLLGIVFGENIGMTLEGQLAALKDDADGRGTPLEQMLRNALSQNLQRGRGGLLADYTGTLADTLATAGRPILRFFDPLQIINWREVGTKTTLIVLKWCEAKDTADFEQIKVWKWLELRIIDGRAYSKIHTGTTEAGPDEAAVDYVPIVINGKPAVELPFSWLGAVDNDSKPDVPPLADLANMNVHHWQSEADIAEIARVVGQPTIWASGLNSAWADKYLTSGITLGSAHGVLLPVGGQIGVVQAEDRNMPLTLAARREDQMAKLGAKLVERNSSTKTATQADYDAQTDNSILSIASSNVEACFNKALAICAEFTGNAGSGEVVMPAKFDVAALDATAITALMAAVQGGMLLAADFVRYMQKIGVADANMSVEEILDAIRTQAPIGVGLTNDQNFQ